MVRGRLHVTFQSLIYRGNEENVHRHNPHKPVLPPLSTLLRISEYRERFLSGSGFIEPGDDALHFVRGFGDVSGGALDELDTCGGGFFLAGGLLTGREGFVVFEFWVEFLGDVCGVCGDSVGDDLRGFGGLRFEGFF